MRSQLLIGAASSGSGKTTFTLGLLRALARKGLVVQPFKCGPDYIDTRHHQMAAGRASVNLDRFMMSEKHIEEVYRRYAFPADIAITEGVMGLFDGYDGMQGSSAEVASALDIPVVLIVNAKSTAYSVAPLLYGFKHFYPKVRVIGAVFNFVASENHYYYLKQACADAGVEALGYLPKQEDITIPSRHLGLSLDSDFCFEAFADRIADLVDKYVCVDRLLELASAPVSAHTEETGTSLSHRPSGSMRISIARDAAFNFVYAENIAYLEQLGNVTYFSLLTDSANRLPLFAGWISGITPEDFVGESIHARCRPRLSGEWRTCVGRMRRHDVPLPFHYRTRRQYLSDGWCIRPDRHHATDETTTGLSYLAMGQIPVGWP